MVGLGENYLPAFALALGTSQVIAGLLGSIPIFIGGCVQLLANLYCNGRFSSKTWIIGASALQAAAFIPLLIAAFVGELSVFGLFAVASLYWASGMAAGPAWNTWISTLVPGKIRPRFFAKRNRFTQLATLGGFLLGGAFLMLGGYFNHILLGFAGIFAVAGLSRCASVIFLAMHHQPLLRSTHSTTTHAASSSSSLSPNPSGISMDFVGGRLILYLVCVQAFVQFSGPFFTPYMLKQLQFSYNMFVVLVATSFIAKALSFSVWGRFSQRFGARRLLWIGGMGIIPAASLWTISNDWRWLLLVQALSGTVWGAYELGFFLRFLQDIPSSTRAKLLTYYNFANASAWCSGALLGAWLLASWQSSYQAYHYIFVLSSVGRIGCLLLLWNVDRQGFGRIFDRIRTATRFSPRNRASSLQPGTPTPTPESTTHAA